MYSVVPRSIYRLFGSSASSVSSRASSYTTSSYSTDMEKSISSYDMISGGGLNSALHTTAPTQSIPASPLFTVGSANSETYDNIAMSSAEARRRSFTATEVDIANAPYTGGYYSSGVQSPTTTLPIQPDEFSAAEITPLDVPRRLHGPRPLRSAENQAGARLMMVATFPGSYVL